jgi:hypothetical protein
MFVLDVTFSLSGAGLKIVMAGLGERRTRHAVSFFAFWGIPVRLFFSLIRAYPNNRVVMRPSEKFEAEAAGVKSPQV